MRLRPLFLVFISCLAIPMTSNAHSEGKFDEGWYFGGGISLNNVFAYEDYCYGCYGSSTHGDSETGFTITGGLRVNDYFAIEGAYYGGSTIGWDEGVVVFLSDPFGDYILDADIELSSWQISAVGVLAWGNWEAFLRVGLAGWDATNDEILTSLSDGSQSFGFFESDGEDLVVGVGIGKNVGDDMQVRLEYASHGLDDELLGVGGNVSANADAISLQLLWRFGNTAE